MGEHLLHTKQMKSRRKSMRNKGDISQEELTEKEEQKGVEAFNKLHDEPNEDIQASIQGHLRTDPEVF